ncbi:helix-turn-helix domain-containing protein [Pseudomonas sp. CF161]|uniref:helix-turn-helix domain-containing protein n=1 Tax=Pseudomonas sp. CF161 TaxID=911241 RepID=UPI00035513D6|nr:helix-turn-helix domain-containing protein [Pseudomonas sp. CF161]EPL16083.1 DNA-binding protein [Pseudomonas sp. CF161]
MSLRRPYAAVLQLLRTRQGLSQQEIAGKVAQSHVSQLETLKTTATVDVTNELASALKVEATTFFALVMAANHQQSARHVLLSALAEIEELGLADEILPQEPRQIEPPRVTAAREKWQAIQELKSKGYSQSQVVLQLGYSKATVWRLWSNEPGV